MLEDKQKQYNSYFRIFGPNLNINEILLVKAKMDIFKIILKMTRTYDLFGSKDQFKGFNF